MTAQPNWNSWTRLQQSSEGVEYGCAMCGKRVGSRNDVKITDKFDRVYCSDDCYSKARSHPSWEYEARGGDY